MKAHRQLLVLSLLICTFSWFNIQPTTGQHTHITSTSKSRDHDIPMTHASPGLDPHWKKVKGAPFEKTGKIRTYYLGADEVVWDYAPAKKNLITGDDFDDTANVFVQTGPNRIGSKYLKCLYREYTNSRFNKLKPRTEDEEYLGFLGPVIRAEVGDIIKIVFKNQCRFPASVHPHGVFYNKDSEGAPYNDDTSRRDKKDDAVEPGDTYTYTWFVPERAGPGPMDDSSVMWMYHSHTDEVRDFYAGLVGPMAITAKGRGLVDGSPNNVDRELFYMYSVTDENSSPYLEDNFERFAEHGPGEEAPVGDEDFIESNLKHGINGYLYGNGPLVNIKKDERVRWYVMSMGNEVDLHTPHWHGNTCLVNDMRMDIVSLLPAGMSTADMVPDNEGIWLFHCHVNDHIDAGMLARYEVVDKKDCSD